ncbi:HlyC/CorC family transporter [Rhodococcus rhodnii]|uniref:CBS domain-containing protein n=2 Tax=Rhodococcus rhodnii TaxID=38312 RepID=R7WSF5_9NOCA|nr:hemolysin family protein [Rhodococcus rhodnii]EOM76889.1 CBS domain-containing protein [Rhodococcus rhodnii LMG 5362]TXG89747.1 HlyC/CorC family transporter [Rhodococcus rhodnii]
MSNPWVVVLVTAVLIASSAFFVAIEFALIGARRHRLEDAAPNSRSARAALRSASELSVLLAGSQLGITVCTLALGATTKPAVHYWLTPIFQDWGMPYWVSDVLGFVLALIIVTFLHLVVGEMAPKSWAIAHPEKSATLLALPMRGFMWVTRPLIVVLNNMANWCLRKVGVEPVDQKSSHSDTDTLRHLVEHSATVGTLDERHGDYLTAALELEQVTVREMMRPGADPSSVPASADCDTIRRTADRSGHLRLVVRDDTGIVGVVHVRDALAAPEGATAGELMRPSLTVSASDPVYAALGRMKDTRTHLAVVADEGRVVGVVTLSDVLERLLPMART